MSVESASNRKRKRIVEHVISGFRNTVEQLVAERIGRRNSGSMLEDRDHR